MNSDSLRKHYQDELKVLNKVLKLYASSPLVTDENRAMLRSRVRHYYMFGFQTVCILKRSAEHFRLLRSLERTLRKLCPDEFEEPLVGLHDHIFVLEAAAQGAVGDQRRCHAGEQVGAHEIGRHRAPGVLQHVMDHIGAGALAVGAGDEHRLGRIQALDVGHKLRVQLQGQLARQVGPAVLRHQTNHNGT